jgi:hypothetical protein
MLSQGVPLIGVGVILIVLGLVPNLLSTFTEALHRLNEELHRELGAPFLEPRRVTEPLASGWLAVGGVVLVTLGFLAVITN